MDGQQLVFDQKRFLADYWQQQPLLIRGAIANFSPPISADELAGLALEDEIESRIIENRGANWHLHHGPFTEQDFNRDTPWTLLVQAVDHYLPEVAELRKLVNFLPQWRVDDVMVSYAVDGGSVGPHYDNYDVFLLQGEGRRNWKVGQCCDSNTALLDHSELRILQEFDCQQEYSLGPGDILYLPPGVAHWGVAEGECTTFSIGFRAPRRNDMLSRWADQMLERMDPESFFSDPGMSTMAQAGEIRPEDLQRAEQQLLDLLRSKQSNHWFGALVTEPRYPAEHDEKALHEARTLLHTGPSVISLEASAKLAWQQDSETITVFANGQPLHAQQEVKEMLLGLCGNTLLEGQELEAALGCPQCLTLLEQLLDLSCLYVE